MRGVAGVTEVTDDARECKKARSTENASITHEDSMSWSLCQEISVQTAPPYLHAAYVSAADQRVDTVRPALRHALQMVKRPKRQVLCLAR